MKAIQTVGLIGAMLAAACVAGAQTLNTNVGVPINATGNPGGSVIVIDELGVEGKATLLANAASFSSSVVTSIPTVFAGDILLVNPTGGNAAANAVADIRFFNPLDPTGSMGLAATEDQVFFASDVGAGGFAAFPLLPNYNFVTVSAASGGVVTGTEDVFGPVGGILSGQLAIIVFTTVPAAVPEPGSLALLVGVSMTGTGFLVRRRKYARK